MNMGNLKINIHLLFILSPGKVINLTKYVEILCEESHKTLMKETKETDRWYIFKDSLLLRCQLFSFHLQNQCCLNQNSSKLTCKYQLTTSKVYIHRQKTPNSQLSVKGER